MYPVAHVVVACGAAWSVERVVHRVFQPVDSDAMEKHQRSSKGSLFDYRFVALGALLPDIIDKPLAWFILGDRVEDNHLFAHTMLFGMLLAIPGLYLAARGNPVLISLACGIFTHLFCDPVLREPRTLLWPLYGWTFHSTYGKGNGLPVNLTLDFVLGSLGLLVLWRLWRAGRLWDLALWGGI
jgi:LexA-binding, inner membrane-associated putative hydrolase